METQYKSKYTDKLVTPAQIITEKLFENIAKTKKEQLPYRFWEIERFKKDYIKHIVGANRLLKQYPVEVILKALESRESGWIFYFSHQKLKALCEKYNKEEKKEVQNVQNVEKVDITQKPRKQTVNQKGLLEYLD